MARPSYLSRRGDGRYYLHLRLPKTAFALYGRSILRASLRTGEFGEARRRLMDNLAWARELIDAPDLEALGAVIHGRLQGYSTRHLMGDWLDAAGVAQRTRDRILGHASAVPGRYGRKSKIDPEQIAAIEKLEPGVVKTMREILMAAKEKAGRGELTVLKPWIKALR
jgi:hypothetical protein